MNGRKKEIVWGLGLTVLVVLLILLAIASSASAKHVAGHNECFQGGPCLTGEQALREWEQPGKGAEYQWNRARKLERKVWKLEKRVAKKFKRDSLYAIKLASRAFGIPERDMRRVAYCESRFNPFVKNPNSMASGLFQFLDSTWASTPFHVAFPVWDPVANALAAAQIVRADGGWRQWVCKP